MQECYIPEESRSIHHLNAKALRIVDLKTLDTQALLNSANSALDFVQKRPKFFATIFFVDFLSKLRMLRTAWITLRGPTKIEPFFILHIPAYMNQSPDHSHYY